MLYLPPQHSERRRGVVLLAVLIVVVLLTLAAYQYSELMMAEYKATASYTKATQARAAAESGVNYAAMLLSDPNNFANVLNSSPFNNAGAFQGIPVGDGSHGPQAYFSVVAPLGPDDTQSATVPFRYGATDESGKINLNALMQLDSTGTLAGQILGNLDTAWQTLGTPNTIVNFANAIIDWMDPDETPRQGGAESDTYSGMQPPYYSKNGPFDTLEELLLVQNVTWDVLYGTDLNRNGIQDPSEQQLGPFNLGWSAYLTVYSREQNIDSQGNPRIYVNDTNTQELYTNLNALGTLTPAMVNFILVYRQYGPMAATPTPTPAPATVSKTGGPAAPPAPVTVTADQLSQTDLNLSTSSRARSLSSVFQLVNVSVQIPAPSRTQPARIVPSPLNDPSQVTTLLPILLDELTTTSNSYLPARVNINTAPQAVLLALPGLANNTTTVSSIMSTRPDPNSTTAPDPSFSSVAWLLTKVNPPIPASTLQTLDRFITARTQVYRVQVVGHFAKGGPACRLEAVIDTNAGRPRIVYWRDLTELGRGFDLSGENLGQ